MVVKPRHGANLDAYARGRFFANMITTTTTTTTTTKRRQKL